MNENVKNAIDLAFDGKINDMGQEIETALMQKVSDIIAGKRVEVAQSLMSPVAEGDEPVEEQEDDEIEESYIEEVLKVSDGVDAWISDFVHSDNPKFEGKSKKERIQMALGAFYSAKKGKTRNEEVEELDELSTDTLKSYKDKAEWDLGSTPEMEKKRDQGLKRATKKIAANEKAKKKYINVRQW